MTTSMTGFGAATRETEDLAVSVSLRAVNHRHLDVQFRLPQSLQHLEPAFRTTIQQAVARGRLECTMTLHERVDPVPVVEIDQALVEAVGRAMEVVRSSGLVAGPLLPGDVLRLPQVLKVREERPDIDAERLTATVVGVLEEGLAALNEMRRREGEFLATELEERRRALLTLVDSLEEASLEAAGAVQQRLLQRVAELRLDPQVDEALVAAEVVKFVARSEIREELVRLRAHLAHWVELVADDEPVGRKLDFLLQEMNREVNTIGSKAEGSRASALVVTAKAELEKMREQVQNVE
ncbi:MAG TPA: YicC/YloC family endoribonuclease [Luteitalea sp.]|nr:YicC/YloC family endoribonuclease [Luteitalea sp.]